LLVKEPGKKRDVMERQGQEQARESRMEKRGEAERMEEKERGSRGLH
jgi:hypothetical protein